MTNLTKHKTAKIISTLFIPQTFTILIFPFLAYNYEPLFLQKWVAIFTALTLGCSVQILTYLYMLKKRKIKSFDEAKKNERTIPFLVQIGFYLIGLFILLFFNVNHLLIVFWSTYIVNNIFLLFINYKWKISSHSIGVAQHFALFIYLMNPIYVAFLPIAYLIGWARVELNVHDKYQILGGLLVGFSLTYLQLYLL
ncbi:MAG: hypothetical protein IIC75_08170 [Bacteroidetes bacterium]|nr:hypothetical protein [Bacteroidota bacterium]